MSFDARLRAISEKYHVNIRVRFEGPSMCYLDLLDALTDEKVEFPFYAKRGELAYTIGLFGGATFERALQELEAFLARNPKVERLPPHKPRDY